MPNYDYRCPECGETRLLLAVPTVHRDTAAPLCDAHDELVTMKRVYGGRVSIRVPHPRSRDAGATAPRGPMNEHY